MEEKKQRRNKRILIISAMLVLLIALLCFGGTTFAKYITSKEAKVEQATVAKWGFVVTVKTDKMFSDIYNEGNIVSKPTDGSAEPTVDVKAEGKVVAPGTKGSMTIDVDGKAEVNAAVSFAELATPVTVSDVLLHNQADGATTTNDYAPIKWTIKRTGTVKDVAVNDFTGMANKTLAECITELKKESYKLNAGDSVDLTYTLEWEWAFSSSDANDEKDTLLGYAAEKKGTATDLATAANGDIVVSADGTTVTVKGDTNTEYTANTTVNFGFKVSVVQTTNKTETPAA